MVSTIGMGAWGLGNSHDTTVRESEVKSLRRGIELGLNLIDTAEIYGEGRSEQLVGQAIKENRERVFLATKVSEYHLKYDDVIEACDGSLARLNVGCIDLYQVHWPNPSVPIRETMKAMEHLAIEGKVKHIGVSNFSVDDIEKARACLSRHEIVSNQVKYSLLSRKAEESIIPYCEREKITVIAYSPLERGGIPSARIPKHLLTNYQLTAAQLLLNWVTHREGVVAIPKAAKIGHVEENAKSIEQKLSSEDLNLLSRAFA